MPERLSVIIPCKNERMNIRPAIESVRSIADEIIVADSGSTDGTLDIVRQAGGCRIIEREYIDSGNFKNWAIPQAAHAWVLILDADERVTPRVAGEIRAVLDDPQARDGYWIYRENYFMGHRIRFCGMDSDRALRLFRRDEGRYNDRGDHSEVIVRGGRIGRLRSRLLHYSVWSYDQYFRKFQRYTTWQAQRWHSQGRRSTLLMLMFRAPMRFANKYFLRLGFLDGKAGLQVCVLTAFYSFMKQARLWELSHAVPQPDPEAAVAMPAVAAAAPEKSGQRAA